MSPLVAVGAVLVIVVIALFVFWRSGNVSQEQNLKNIPPTIPPEINQALNNPKSAPTSGAGNTGSGR
jgi:hypothetical protein